MKDEIKLTDSWQIYQKGVDFLRLRGEYSNTDLCFRMVYGDQWEGLPKGPVENIQYNILQPIVDYKVGTINSNLWAINYSSDNFEDKEFQEVAKETCILLNKHAARIWEKDNMDDKIYDISEDACIDKEGIIYVDFKDGEPSNEMLNKVDVYYGNENSTDIQTQPYIIIKSRRPVDQIREMAQENGVNDEEIMNIVGDMNTSEEAGQDSKKEINDMCIILTKLWKEKGKVWYSKSTKTVDIVKPTNSGLSLYPIAHFVWKKVKGSSRGVGEVQYIIPNQLEINKTAMRRALVVKQTAYQQKVIDSEKISNVSDVDKIGVTLKAKGMNGEDVKKVITTTQPATMSRDAKELQDELISTTRELANAGDATTGQIDPEQASGKAILAVQQASRQPLKKQEKYLKRCIEDIARIWVDGLVVYSPNGLQVLKEETTTDPVTGETTTIEVPYTIPATVLEKMKTSSKVDTTPIGAYDKYANELSIENLVQNPNFMNTQWLEDFESLLDDGSVMPKTKIKDLIKRRKEAQKQIAQVQIEAAKVQTEYDDILNDVEELTPPMPQEQMV